MVFCVCGYMGKQGGQITDQGHMVGTAAADHILPDDHAQPVTVIIPAQGLQLDVLTQHIKAHFLCQPDIPDKGLVAGGGHQAVGPVALIQKAMKKIGSVIQTEPGDPFFVGLYGEGAQCKVALYGVLVCCQSKGVQVRLLRRPQPEAFPGQSYNEGTGAARKRFYGNTLQGDFRGTALRKSFLPADRFKHYTGNMGEGFI